VLGDAIISEHVAEFYYIN